MTSLYLFMGFSDDLFAVLFRCPAAGETDISGISGISDISDISGISPIFSRNNPFSQLVFLRFTAHGIHIIHPLFSQTQSQLFRAVHQTAALMISVPV